MGCLTACLILASFLLVIPAYRCGLYVSSKVKPRESWSMPEFPIFSMPVAACLVLFISNLIVNKEEKIAKCEANKVKKEKLVAEVKNDRNICRWSM